MAHPTTCAWSILSLFATGARNGQTPWRGALVPQARVGRSFRCEKSKKRSPRPLFTDRRVSLAASTSSTPASPEDDLDVFGFSEEWEVQMVAFWRDWNQTVVEQERTRHKIRENDIKNLVELGRVEESFAHVETVYASTQKLSSLLPDAHVPNMFQREPNLIHMNFAKASQSILTLQEVLCSNDRCNDVTPVLERHPKLLLCSDVLEEVDLAVKKLKEIAPDCDARKAVSEYPELLYRIHSYNEYAELPISIMNIILETSTQDISEKVDDYNAVWDEWERASGVCSGFVNQEGEGDRFANGDHSMDHFDPDDASEWMSDGFWESEE